MMPMFSGHFVATTNITMRMTSGMIWMVRFRHTARC